MNRSKYLHKTRNNRWTERDDHELTRLVQQYGYNWNLISQKMGSKLGKSCRERWVNQLDPSINRDEWSDEEQWRLYLSVALYGTQWSQISKMFERRPDKHIKNYWNTVKMKQRCEEFATTIQHVFLARGLDQLKGNKTFIV